MSDVLEPGLEGPWDFGSFTVTCSRSSRADLVSTLWPVYEESFGPLRVLAAARHVLTQDEFAEELDDPRIWKYIALDREGRPAGLATLADDLSALPWISPEYYAHKYPEETSRRAAFYNGLTLVRPDMRRYPVFARLVACIGTRVAATRGIVAFDIGGFNDQDRSLAKVTGRLLNKVAEFDVQAVDVQTYYVARAGSRSKEDS